MPHRLLIRLFADGAAEWLAQARDGAVLQGPQAGLPDLAADEIVLLLPAEDVLLLDAPRIGRSVAQLAQALPYAIEEQLVAAVETQQIAIDERSAGDPVAVAVIDRARLDAALARLRDAGLAPDRAYAESQLLPFAPPSAWCDGERIVLRWARSAALVTDRAGWPATRELLAASGAPANGWRGYGDVAGLDGIDAAPEPVGEPLRWLAGRLAAIDGPNLLQGDYRPARRHAQSTGLWRWAAGLAAATLVLGLLTAVIERAQLERQVAARQQEMEGLLRHALPGVQRVVDPVAQLRVEQQRLGQRQTGGALPLLATVAPVLAGSGRYTVDAIEYRGQTLDLVVTAPDVAALDRLRESLAALPPLQVELTAATPGSRGVEGRLRVRGGES